MHIGFDMDGVLIDHSVNKQAAAARFGITLALAQTPSGVFRNQIPDEHYPLIDEIVHSDPEVGKRAIVMPGVQEFLDQVCLVGLSHTLISRRQNPDLAQILLKHHGFSPKYFNEHNTFFVPDKPSKNVIAKQVGVTHYIDDEPSVLEHLTDVPNKFLFDPHNVWPDSLSYTRVCSWADMGRLFFKTDN